MEWMSDLQICYNRVSRGNTVSVGGRMMADAEEVRMLAEITRLYYEEEWTQQRIAKKFNMRSLRNGFRSERQCASVWKTVKIR